MVPLPPGGSNEVLARLKMSEAFGQPVLVDGIAAVKKGETVVIDGVVQTGHSRPSPRG